MAFLAPENNAKYFLICKLNISNGILSQSNKRLQSPKPDDTPGGNIYRRRTKASNIIIFNSNIIFV